MFLLRQNDWTVRELPRRPIQLIVNYFRHWQTWFSCHHLRRAIITNMMIATLALVPLPDPCWIQNDYILAMRTGVGISFQIPLHTGRQFSRDVPLIHFQVTKSSWQSIADYKHDCAQRLSGAVTDATSFIYAPPGT